MSLVLTNSNPIATTLAPTPFTHTNTQPITYPYSESTLTYGIDQLVKTWEKEKYYPSTTSLGKAFDWITGWTLDENGNPNPSILDRIMNVFSKTKDKEIKEVIDENYLEVIPDGKVLSYDLSNSKNIIGTFEIQYFQTNCSDPSYLDANWNMRIEVDVPEDIKNYGYTFYKNLGKCLSTSMLNDYFKSVGEYCQNSTICGCPKEEKLFSYIYTLKESSLKVFNTNTQTSQILFPNQDYPAPNFDLIQACYDESVDVCTQAKLKDYRTTWLIVGSTFGIIGVVCGTFTCIAGVSTFVGQNSTQSNEGFKKLEEEDFTTNPDDIEMKQIEV